MNNKVPFSNNMDNKLLRTEYKPFKHIQVGDSMPDKTPGSTGSQKLNVMASAARVLTEGAGVGPGPAGGDTGQQGATPGLYRHCGGQTW